MNVELPQKQLKNDELKNYALHRLALLKSP